MPTLSNHGHVQTQAIGSVLHSYPAVSARVSRIMVKLAKDPLNIYEQYAAQAMSWPPGEYYYRPNRTDLPSSHCRQVSEQCHRVGEQYT